MNQFVNQFAKMHVSQHDELGCVAEPTTGLDERGRNGELASDFKLHELVSCLLKILVKVTD